MRRPSGWSQKNISSTRIPKWLRATNPVTMLASVFTVALSFSGSMVKRAKTGIGMDGITGIMGYFTAQVTTGKEIRDVPR